MWVICFQPAGTDKFVPQLICNSEQEAKQIVNRMPFSVVGTYNYMFVPMASPNGYFQRNETPYQFPGYQSPIPYYTDPNERRPWQIEVGDWPFPPQITC